MDFITVTMSQVIPSEKWTYWDQLPAYTNLWCQSLKGHHPYANLSTHQIGDEIFRFLTLTLNL